jgi:hypothetical protein
MRDEIAKLKEAVEKLKEIAEQLQIQRYVKDLHDAVSDLYHFIERGRVYFYIRLDYGRVKVRGTYWEWIIDKASEKSTIEEVYNLFFNDNEIFMTMLRFVVARLYDIAYMLSEHLDIPRLVVEANKLIEELREKLDP